MREMKTSPRSRLSSPFFFTPQGFINFIDKLTLNLCFMEITNKSSAPDPDMWIFLPYAYPKLKPWPIS